MQHRSDAIFSRPHGVRAAAVFVGCISALASTEALGSGFMVRENSAASVGMAFAGNGSRADTPATVFNNPAGMTRLTDDEVELGIAGIIPNVEFHGTASARGAPLSGTNGDNAGRVVIVPNLSWTFGLTDRWKAGLAVTVPFGLGVAYDSPWVGRYLNIKTSALAIDINPNVAYRLSPGLSLGAGISAQYLKLDTTTAIPQFAIFGPGAPDAFYRFNAHDWAFGYNLGALVELDGATRVGLTYRSQVDHRIKGDLDFTGTSPILGLVSGPAAANAHLPATAGASITKDLSSDLSLSADIQFSQWSVFKRVVIESANPPFPNEERYRDSWMVSVGGVYRLDDIWKLRAGLAWDQTPVTDAFRAVTLPDEDRYLLGVGFGYKLSDAASLDGAYEHSFASKHASMNNSFNNTDPITHAVALNGTYDVAVDIVAFSLRYKY